MATPAEGTQSDEVIDFKFSFCSRKGKVKHSEKFCVECKQQLCSECLQLHNHLHDDHTLLEPARSTGQQVLPINRCEKHGDKVLEMFCEDHDEVGCSTCAYVDHRLCKTVLNIPSAIQKLYNVDDIKYVSKELEKARITFTERRESRSKHREVLKAVREENLSKVDECTEKLVNIIQALGTATKKNLMDEFDKEDEQIQTNEAKSRTVERNVQKCLQQLDNENENLTQLFISMKKGCKLLKLAHRIGKDSDIILKKGPPHIMMDDSMEKYLAEFKMFKMIKQPTLYKIKEKFEFNVKVKADSRNCWIWDSCLLPDNTLLITDRHNKKLKHVDTTNLIVKDHCDLPDKPFGVCCVSHQEAAVCLENKSIQLVSLNNNLTLTHSIKQDFTCSGIAYHGNKFYVATENDNIKILNNEGSVIQTVSSHEASSFRQTKKVAVNTLDGNVFITDKINGLICTDSSGHQLFQYKGNGLNNAVGLCAESRGSIFVSGFLSANVVQVTGKGEYLGEVLSASSGLMKPLSLSWDGVRSRLYVTTGSNKIYALDMDNCT